MNKKFCPLSLIGGGNDKELEKKKAELHQQWMEYHGYEHSKGGDPHV